MSPSTLINSQTILPFWSSFLAAAPIADAAERPVVALRADEMPDHEDSLRLVLDGTRTALLDLLAMSRRLAPSRPPAGRSAYWRIRKAHHAV